MEQSWKTRCVFGPYALVILTTALAAQASAAPITESQAIRRYLEQSPLAQRVPLVEQSAAATVRTGAILANPELSYQREDAGGVLDAFVTLQQKLPAAGLRGILGEQARAAASSAGLAARREVQEDVYQLRLAFHEVVYREGVQQHLREGRARLEETVTVLREREREGEGSGYDVLRAEQELTELRMTLRDAEASVRVARLGFAAFFNQDTAIASADLLGDLATGSPTPASHLAATRAVEQRLDIHSLMARQEQLQLEQRAARRKRLPAPVVSAGWKRTEAVGLSDTGYTAAVSIPLPIFDRGQVDAARAAADARQVELETELLTRAVQAEAEIAVARERAARDMANAYTDQANARTAELYRVAQLLYAEGESNILELLDAKRTLLTSRLHALSMQYEAKVAEIQRQHVTGSEVQP